MIAVQSWGPKRAPLRMTDGFQWLNELLYRSIPPGLRMAGGADSGEGSELLGLEDAEGRWAIDVEGIVERGGARRGLGEAAAARLKAGGVGARDVQAVHDDVTGAQAVDGGGKLRGDAAAVNVDDERGLGGIVKALANADAEERGILGHDIFRDLLLEGDSAAENSRRQ